MSGLNGSANGHHKPAHAGVGGGLVLGDLADPHRKRGTYAMLERAVNVGLDMPPDTLKAAVSTAIKDMGDIDNRIRARAREFLLAVQTKSVDAAIALDKIERLDDGKPTERHDVSVRDMVRRVLTDPEAHQAMSTLAERMAEQMENENL